jgi:hypothetical protein
MPAQNRGRCHDWFDFSQYPPSERLAFRGQPPTLIIVETKSFISLQLAYLFLQVCMDGSVLFVHPAREHHHEHL